LFVPKVLEFDSFFLNLSPGKPIYVVLELLKDYNEIRVTFLSVKQHFTQN